MFTVVYICIGVYMCVYIYVYTCIEVKKGGDCLNGKLGSINK